MSFDWSKLSIDIAGIKAHYGNDDFSPEQLLQHLHALSATFAKKNIWIYRLNEKELSPYLAALKEKPKSLPLWGVPFAIKDNIDLAGVPTTAACPDFSYVPKKNATVVENLIAAGAIPVGKTNLDQFATGLVGTRSPAPYGICRNAFDDETISGGSSSGSAVALSLGLVSFALGTDTAGSGRVPAALNNIIGFKATKGLISTSGVVPACRSLDVVSIFALSLSDAQNVFSLAASYDAKDPYSRKNSFENGARCAGIAKGSVVLGVPKKSQLNFFGDKNSESAFWQCLDTWQDQGANIQEKDFSAFLDAAKLLYEGPWVAERYVATQKLVDKNPEALHPVVRKIVSGGKNLSAADTFKAFYRLQELKQLADAQFASVDLIITPTIGTAYSIAALEQDPITLNSNLGYYTNYMNLLDYCGIALPYKQENNHRGLGFTLVGKAFEDQKMLSWAACWVDNNISSLGACNLKPSPNISPVRSDIEQVTLAVCGAHLSGEALNWQLLERDATLVRADKSSADYRLYALADGLRPGMIRSLSGGAAIDLELWQMPVQHFGSFVAAIPPPLGIGKIELQDGSWVCGFMCDNSGLEGSTDITEFGAWRKYLASR